MEAPPEARDEEYERAGAKPPAVGSASRWPLFAVWGLSAAAASVAVLDDKIASLIAYGVLLTVGVALLIIYRMSVVRASMSAGAGTVGALLFERIAVAAIVLGCLANGIVVGRWVGTWELWSR